MIGSLAWKRNVFFLTLWEFLARWVSVLVAFTHKSLFDLLLVVDRKVPMIQIEAIIHIDSKKRVYLTAYLIFRSILFFSLQKYKL